MATIAILQQRTPEQSFVENGQLGTALTGRVLVDQVKGVLADPATGIISGAFDTDVSPARRLG